MNSKLINIIIVTGKDGNSFAIDWTLSDSFIGKYISKMQFEYLINFPAVLIFYLQPPLAI